MTAASSFPTQNWIVRKPAVRTRGGLVVSQSLVAASAGARVLENGGNAVDAAVATGLALAVVEPWNSGLGGIGFMVLWIAAERRAVVVDFGPVAPRRLNPADYPLSGGATGGDLFAWPAVVGERNVHGPLSIAVPGAVDGWALAHERFGALPWRDVLRPAIELAERGLAVDWYTTLRAALWARELARDRHSASIWLPDGLPIASPPGITQPLVIPKLAATLRRLADAGGRDFYEGALADAIVADLDRAGAALDRDDLVRYRARLVEPLAFDYRGTRMLAAGGLTAGPTLAAALTAIGRQTLAGSEPDAEAYLAYAKALSEAYAERFRALGDVADALHPTSTTHVNVVDRDGNVVALTQTLLSVFGSKVTLPSTGILMNNGIMWFDPRPGGPNAIGPGKRPLSNMCPVLALRDGRPTLAIGASGGRRILPAVTQVLSFVLDYGMDLPAAFHQPRIDASGEAALHVDPRLPRDVADALASRFPTRMAEYLVMPDNYARPSAIHIDAASGERTGMTDVMSPWSGAVAESVA